MPVPNVRTVAACFAAASSLLFARAPDVAAASVTTVPRTTAAPRPTTAPTTTTPARTVPTTLPTTLPTPTSTAPTTTKPPPVIVHIATTSYVLPANRPIVDGWRPPSGPYGAGNLGLEIGTVVGDRLVAPQGGTVTFAGQVGGTLYLVISHNDGIRTTLGGLSSIAVSRGASVRRGQFVGAAGGTTHFGARYVNHYLDPTLLLGPSVPERSWLVPARGG
jgi:murein DD-endopeptidase MepM/ murein hydrolase activator NlpD